MVEQPFGERIDFYSQRHTFAPGQVFIDYEGDLIKLDRSVPGDASAWYVATWNSHTNGWSYEDCRIEPSDLIARSDDPESAS